MSYCELVAKGESEIVGRRAPTDFPAAGVKRDVMGL